MSKANTNVKSWTYGVEHELADWDTRAGWDGYGRDPEPNIVNSNGIAADPNLISYPFGGEINTPPSETIEEQGEHLAKFLARHPLASANYRTGMHVHIRVPGLKEDLTALKKLQTFISDNAEVYNFVDPISIPEANGTGERKRAQWMRMSHHTVIPRARVERQLVATTINQFFELEVPRSKAGKPLWHAQPRAAVNLRQLLQTDTIEFRHFVQTLDPAEVINAVTWCRDYLVVAFYGGSAVTLYQTQYERRRVALPRLETFPYRQWMEDRWLLTSISKRTREAVDEGIDEVLREERRKGLRKHLHP